MLWQFIPNGCYIDVGAQDPVADSVSPAFYERGWRGSPCRTTVPDAMPPPCAPRGPKKRSYRGSSWRDARPGGDVPGFPDTGSVSTGVSDIIADLHAASGLVRRADSKFLASRSRPSSIVTGTTTSTG